MIEISISSPVQMATASGSCGLGTVDLSFRLLDHIHSVAVGRTDIPFVMFRHQQIYGTVLVRKKRESTVRGTKELFNERRKQVDAIGSA
ncbi:hypothetical protein [Loktanella fryxellensis]|uniref:hypothetical protein n=1 Tax=Loktanella fryxellensis TaxID=245187 RepID=UPI000B7EBC50|nr:hypothetical protein [Loktanella fryxellensis]